MLASRGRPASGRCGGKRPRGFELLCRADVRASAPSVDIIRAASREAQTEAPANLPHRKVVKKDAARLTGQR